MAVIVVGDLDPAEAETYIKKHFDHLRNPSSPRPREEARVNGRSKSEGIVVTDPEATNHVVEVHYSYKKEKKDETLGDYREYLVRRLFTSMLSQRMQELTQKAEPPFVFGGTFIRGYARGYEEFQSLAYLGQGGVEPVSDLHGVLLGRGKAMHFPPAGRRDRRRSGALISPSDLGER